MPVTYHCDNCDVTATSLVGWKIISVTFIVESPSSGPPGGRASEGVAADLIFHDDACRTAWVAKAAPLVAPTVPA